MQKAAYTVNQLAQEIGIARSTIYKEISAGRLKPRKIGKKTIFLAQDVQDYLNALPRFKSGIPA